MDLDEIIEAEAGKSIPEIFAEIGESGFRQMEHRVLSSVLSVKTEEGEDRATRGTKAGGPQAKRSGGVSEANVRTSSVEQTETEEGTTTILQIISLGGGTIMTRECAKIVRERTLCVYLKASVQTLTEHLEGETQGRPMLSGNVHERISELMAQRAVTYESTAHVIIDIDGMSVDEVAHAIIDSLSRR